MIYDKLTKLLYYDDFKEEVCKIIDTNDKPCMLISLNLSNFKYINSIYGYEKGDWLLSELAHYFFHINEHCLLASRVHSDRFVALVLISEDVPEKQENKTQHYDQIHKQFVQNLEQEVPLAVLRINAGAYIITNPKENISEMLDKAELARRSIKNSYEQTICFFTPELEEKAKIERSIIPLFERSIKEDTILVFLQPKIDIDTQELIGAEALARLVDDEGNIISPGDFIPVLEKYGMISQLDAYVAAKVFRLLNSWQARGMELIPISLNLSRVYFNQLEEWADSLEEQVTLEVPRKYIEFEVTETVFFEDVNLISNRVKLLRERGYRISMDDFGTGFSSLNILGMLPLDIIKLDRGFVQNSIQNRKGLEIMAGLVNIFDKIDLDVICEGVETSEEEKIIRACGCKSVQGYLHDKPISILEFENKYLKSTVE